MIQRDSLLTCRGLTLVTTCDSTYVILYILYYEEAIINCDNYGEGMSFALAISGEKKEKQETIAVKRRGQRI